MGLLDQLWDDTVAGPRPENGLGKLRKHNTFSFRSASSGKESEGAAATRSFCEDSSEETVRVTRSIMIVKPPGYSSTTPPISPAGSTTPVSPFSVDADNERYLGGSDYVTATCGYNIANCLPLLAGRNDVPAQLTANGGSVSRSREPFRFRRRSSSDAYEKESPARPKSLASP